MRRFPLIILLVFVACVIIFIGSFVLLDSQKRNTYHYIISLNGHDIGAVRIDRFNTEEKIVYKSSSDIPFYPVYTSFKARIAYNRKYILESFLSEASGAGASKSYYIENMGRQFSFVSRAASKFACLGDIPIKYRTFVFDESMPVTYLPLIENFDFRRGKSQGFNSVTPFSDLLPPVKRYVTLTSIKNEYLKIDNWKVKSECLLLKIRNYPQGAVWVSRADRSLMLIEFPNAGITIRRTFFPKKTDAAAYPPVGESLASREIVFGNKGAALAGTIVYPKDGQNLPAAVLVWGDSSDDRHYQGLFMTLSRALAREGFAVLSFDKRGSGNSEGDSSAVRESDIAGDINAAIDLLKAQKETDPGKIFLIGHGKGTVYASAAASARDDIKGLVLLSPVSALYSRKDADFGYLRDMAAQYGWSEDYLKLAMKAWVETMEKVRAARSEWTSILGKRCFVQKMREESALDPIGLAAKVKAPVLIIKGNQDDTAPAGSEKKIEQALQEGGNRNVSLVYFSYLGHFLGSKVLDGINKMGYVADSGIVGAIKKWSAQTLAKPPDPPPTDTPPTTPAPPATTPAPTPATPATLPTTPPTTTTATTTN